MRTPVAALLTGSALSLCLLLASPTLAEDAPVGLGVGDRAVDFKGTDFFNTDPVSLKELRGRIVLLELFSTT